ncbi:hypothetical protein JW710_00955 [Candidatus Dojkabacteria bacterium]|nr:hypothetical protein [Candidatus Dojkabacteria bacterium]
MKWRFLTILTVAIAGLIALPVAALAWDDCPHGEVNDEYPGDCPRYVDTDGDGICDRSQPAPEDRVTEEETYGQDIESTTEIIARRNTDSSNNETSDSSADSGNSSSSKGKKSSHYNFVVPFFTSLVLYLISWYLAKSKKIERYIMPIHNGIWNTVLLVSLIPSVAFGFYLVLRYAFPEIRISYFDFLYWHVEGSIVMGTVAIMHLIQRLTTYIGQLKLAGRLLGK